MKRGELRRKKGLDRHGWARRTGRLNAMSDKRRDEAPTRKEVREAVFDRDGGCMAQGVPGLGPCFGAPFTFHHVLKASQGGAYTEDNGLTMCAGHNDLFEQDADAAAIAEACGFVRRRNPR